MKKASKPKFKEIKQASIDCSEWIEKIQVIIKPSGLKRNLVLEARTTLKKKHPLMSFGKTLTCKADAEHFDYKTIKETLGMLGDKIYKEYTANLLRHNLDIKNILKSKSKDMPKNILIRKSIR